MSREERQKATTDAYRTGMDRIRWNSDKCHSTDGKKTHTPEKENKDA